MNKNTKKKRKGFTLIELIIVLAIMAIIAAIAIPNFTSVRDNSKDKADAQSCQTIKRAVLMVVTDGGIKADAQKVISFTDGNDSAMDLTAFASDSTKTEEEEKFKDVIKDVKKPQGHVITAFNADNSVAYDKTKMAAKYKVTIETNGDVNVVTLDK